jgi:hypothetical protein
MNMDPGLTSADLAWDRAVSVSPSPQECVEDPSRHAKDCRGSAKDRRGNAKDRRGSKNAGVRGASAKTLGHETVSRIPLSAVRKVEGFHDLGAAAA